MPGGGKSTVGKQLARRLNVPFFDTDDIIRQQVGCSIAAFFEAQGEERFRDVEGSALQGLLARTTETGRVIATGGGIVLREANRQALANDAISIYLRAGPEELFRRVRHDTRRPLLRVRDPLAKLRDLYTQRDPLYRAVSAFVIETGRPSVSMLVNLILMQLELAGLVDTGRLVSDSVKSSTQGKA
jgi:shikimate kinase